MDAQFPLPTGTTDSVDVNKLIRDALTDGNVTGGTELRRPEGRRYQHILEIKGRRRGHGHIRNWAPILVNASDRILDGQKPCQPRTAVRWVGYGNQYKKERTDRCSRSS